MDLPLIALGMAARQTPASGFSHFDGSTEELIARIQESWHLMKPTYRAHDKSTGLCDKGLPFGGVIAIPLTNIEGFWSGVVQLTEGDTLVGKFSRRQGGEEPRKSMGAPNKAKMPAASVDVILYHKDVLLETKGEVKGVWEIVSINGNPIVGEVPIELMVLLHNHFGSSGGTSTGLTAEELVEMLRTSFEFWKDKALAVSR